LVRRLYWGALNRGYLDDVYGRAAVAPALALGRTLERLDRAVLDRPPPAVTPPPGIQLATWEERFHVLRSGHAAGATSLAEPPERLDWLPAGPEAALPRPQDHPHGAVLRTGATARRVSAWSERVIFDQASGPGLFDRAANVLAGIAERTERTVFQASGPGLFDRAANVLAGIAERTERIVFQPSGRGLFDRAAHVLAGIAERTERTVFQPLDTTTLKLTGLIAGITDAFERAVFQSGVERGVVNAAAGSQRLLLSIERRLGRPPVIGSILALALLILIVGTR
jgi:hypothetical protein